MKSSYRSRALSVLVACATIFNSYEARAWGEEGHMVIALIADQYLQPAVRARVATLLQGDTSGVVADRSMASESVWADRYRDSDRNTTRVRYLATGQWHYVDIELDAPDLAAACFGRVSLPAGVAASAGPANDCVVDKIDQFREELSDARTPVDEQRVALQFLLHFVGDLHQPLHAADEHDQGGNLEQVDAPGSPALNLHRYWDTQLVQALGTDARSVAAALIGQISPQDLEVWQRGSSADWAMESFGVGKSTTFGMLPSPYEAHHYHLSAAYVQAATDAVRLQLKRAGVRLALLLNQTLG
jgi:hypothetical protein